MNETKRNLMNKCKRFESHCSQRGGDRSINHCGDDDRFVLLNFSFFFFFLFICYFFFFYSSYFIFLKCYLLKRVLQGDRDTPSWCRWWQPKQMTVNCIVCISSCGVYCTCGRPLMQIQSNGWWWSFNFNRGTGILPASF